VKGQVHGPWNGCWELSSWPPIGLTGSRRQWLRKDDIVFDASKFRLPYEHVLERRGPNAKARYAHIIAWRWLLDIGIGAELNHVLRSSETCRMRPDLFEPTSKIAYEVKSGYLDTSKRARDQAVAYRKAVLTRQASKVIYLNVAVLGEFGMSPGYRLMLEECDHQYLFLK
jgi:hypothetical protein